MTTRFNEAIATFEHAMDRARQMISLYDALSAIRRGDPANDDALRSAYFQAVSSFDFFAHELAAIEAKHRFSTGVRTRNIALPMEVMTIANIEERVSTAEAQIRQSNSYKAFVDPAKLAEMLACYCEKPWMSICTNMNLGKPTSEQRSPVDVKGQLKSIWKRRNQIAHEADVNPMLSGISLWPIYKSDTEFTISFMLEIGRQLPIVISTPLPELDNTIDIESDEQG
ncbi:MAG: hypothetical protein ACT6Q8_03890 [Niveispirillum sp.]|uniref:hypothetical protein n=1 Tax=Niveispirillum sp. TaxID=1917217 RepID=UPI004036A3E2